MCSSFEFELALAPVRTRSAPFCIFLLPPTARTLHCRVAFFLAAEHGLSVINVQAQPPRYTTSKFPRSLDRCHSTSVLYRTAHHELPTTFSTLTRPAIQQINALSPHLRATEAGQPHSIAVSRKQRTKETGQSQPIWGAHTTTFPLKLRGSVSGRESAVD
jgi:hypothetical protein